MSEKKERQGYEGAMERADAGGEREDNILGRVVATMMLGAIFLGCIVFFLTQYSVLTACHTWGLLDAAIAIFIAVVWFQAFDDLCDWGAFTLHQEVFAGFLHACLIFGVALALAWTLREHHQHLTVFTACGAHYLAFAAVHFGGTFQEAWFSSSVFLAFISVLVLFGLLILLSYVARCAKHQAHLDDDDYQDAVEDLENDAGAMCLAFVWTMFVRYLVLGSYPALEEGEKGGRPEHTALTRGLFLMYALAMLGAAAALMPILNTWLAESDSWAKARMNMLLSSFFTMAVAWAFLLWADWEFYEASFRRSPMEGRVWFAILATLACLTLILPLANVTYLDSNLGKLAIGALSLIVAFSWEEAFDQALDTLTEKGSHPAGIKLLMAFTVGVVVLPVYTQYMRPIVERAEQAEKEAALES